MKTEVARLQLCVCLERRGGVGREVVVKNNQQSGTIFTASPPRTPSGMGARGKITVHTAKSPTFVKAQVWQQPGELPAGTTAAARPLRPRLAAPLPQRAGTHAAPRPQRAAPSLLHKAAACSCPRRRRCQLRCDGPIGQHFPLHNCPYGSRQMPIQSSVGELL